MLTVTIHRTRDCSPGAEWESLSAGSFNLMVRYSALLTRAFANFSGKCRYLLAGDIQSWSCSPSTSTGH